MQQDAILQHFILIITVLELVQAFALAFLSNFYSSLKNKRLEFQGYVVRDPSHLHQDFSNKRKLYFRLLLTSSVIIGVSAFLQFQLNTQNLLPLSVSIIKFTFGVIAFSSIQKIIASFLLWFQLKQTMIEDLIIGKITFSEKYLRKLSAFTFLLYACATGFFAFITLSAYFVGGATVFAIFALRDWLSYKRIQKQTANI